MLFGSGFLELYLVFIIQFFWQLAICPLRGLAGSVLVVLRTDFHLWQRALLVLWRRVMYSSVVTLMLA